MVGPRWTLEEGLHHCLLHRLLFIDHSLSLHSIWKWDTSSVVFWELKIRVRMPPSRGLWQCKKQTRHTNLHVLRVWVLIVPSPSYVPLISLLSGFWACHILWVQQRVPIERIYQLSCDLDLVRAWELPLGLLACYHIQIKLGSLSQAMSSRSHSTSHVLSWLKCSTRPWFLFWTLKTSSFSGIRGDLSLHDFCHVLPDDKSALMPTSWSFRHILH